MNRANFISIEDDGVDLILSFALDDEASGVRSLILMRTPQFELLVPEDEKCVRVSLEGDPTFEEDDFLVRTILSDKHIEIATQSKVCQVDLSKVDKDDIKALYKFLQKMNFDNKFEVSHA